MKFSIVIPTYEYNGKGIEFLSRSLESVLQQTFHDYEVVIIDHSIDNDIQHYVSRIDSQKIKYFRNERGRGNSSVNMNEGIVRSRAEYIKILHADDWFNNINCLQMINDAVSNSGRKWGGLGFDHFIESKNVFERYSRPYKIPEYQALAGCPSTSFFINEKSSPDLYDENFIIINDADMHIRLQKRYGDPILIDDCCVTIRVHDLQVTNTVSSQRKTDELARYKAKHCF